MYNLNPAWCGEYDDDNFQSLEMCCVCGGGSTGSDSGDEGGNEGSDEGEIGGGGGGVEEEITCSCECEPTDIACWEECHECLDAIFGEEE